MNKCGYYSCPKGKPTCKHPIYGEIKTKLLRENGADYRWHPCERCKRECHGIYPSSLPKEDISNITVEVVDKNGTIIN